MKFLGLKYFHLVNEEMEASKKIKNVPQIIQIIVGWDFSPFLQVLYSFHYTTSAKKKKKKKKNLSGVPIVAQQK